jgi:hypothetical protein
VLGFEPRTIQSVDSGYTRQAACLHLKLLSVLCNYQVLWTLETFFKTLKQEISQKWGQWYLRCITRTYRQTDGEGANGLLGGKDRHGEIMSGFSSFFVYPQTKRILKYGTHPSTKPEVSPSRPRRSVSPLDARKILVWFPQRSVSPLDARKLLVWIPRRSVSPLDARKILVWFPSEEKII